MDIDRRTGAVLDNLGSALQSVEIIFTTKLAEMVMLREFGCGALALLGRKLTPRLVSAFTLLLAASIDLWEPRFRVRRAYFGGTVDEVRRGSASIQFEVEWRPNAHKGDPTVESIVGLGLDVFGRLKVTS